MRCLIPSISLALAALLAAPSASAITVNKSGNGVVEGSDSFFFNPRWFTDKFITTPGWILKAGGPALTLNFDLTPGHSVGLGASSSFTGLAANESAHIEFSGGAYSGSPDPLVIQWAMEFTGSSGDFQNAPRNAAGNPVIGGQFSVRTNNVGSVVDYPDFIPNGGSISFTDLHLTLTPLRGGGEFQVTDVRFGVDGRFATINAPAPIPEPSQYALLIAGLAVIGALKRRSRSTPR